MLGWLLHAPRGPFYSHKAARSRWRQSWKANLAFCRVDSHCSCPVHDCFPKQVQSTVAASVPMALRTLSGAPCRPLVRATHRPRIARPTVALATVGSPDSPVNYSRTPLIFSRERPFHRRPAWHTGHCPVHHRTLRCARLSWVLAAPSQVFLDSFLLLFSLFLALR
jgi:hypothetical protein